MIGRQRQRRTLAAGVRARPVGGPRFAAVVRVLVAGASAVDDVAALLLLHPGTPVGTTVVATDVQARRGRGESEAEQGSKAHGDGGVGWALVGSVGGRMNGRMVNE